MTLHPRLGDPFVVTTLSPNEHGATPLDSTHCNKRHNLIATDAFINNKATFRSKWGSFRSQTAEAVERLLPGSVWSSSQDETTRLLTRLSAIKRPHRNGWGSFRCGTAEAVEPLRAGSTLASSQDDHTGLFQCQPLQFGGPKAGKARPAYEIASMKLFKIAGSGIETGWLDGNGGTPSSDVLADMPIEVRRYGERTWGVYCGGELLCVTVYLRGARAVESLLGRMQEALRAARTGEFATKIA